jgi:hypothetical protein
MRLRHPHHVGTALSQIEEKMKRRALFGTERPALFELLNFAIGP